MHQAAASSCIAGQLWCVLVMCFFLTHKVLEFSTLCNVAGCIQPQHVVCRLCVFHSVLYMSLVPQRVTRVLLRHR